MSPLNLQDGDSLDASFQHNAAGTSRPDPFPSVGALGLDGIGEPDSESRTAGQPILYVGAMISLVAASIHLLVTPEHFQEWWGYGVFFLISALLQVLFALVLVQRPSRAVLIAGMAGNLAIVAMWAVSRASGVPYVGPNAGEIEEIAVHDIVATTAEIALVLLLAHIFLTDIGSSATKPAKA